MEFFKETTKQHQSPVGRKHKPFQPLGDNYIDTYVEEKSKSKALVWNETQLMLITQTLIYFFDTLSEKFLNIQAPGDAAWFLEEFQEFNQAVKKYGYESMYGEVFPHVKKIEVPLIRFASPKSDPTKQLTEEERSFFSPLLREFSKSLLFVRRWFYKLRLDRDISDGECNSDKHYQQANEIAGELIEAAIKNLKDSKEYQAGLVAGTLYRYSPQATEKPHETKKMPPPGERDSTDSSSSLSSAGSMTSQEGSRSTASTPESEASPLQSASSHFHHPSTSTNFTNPPTKESTTSDGVTINSGSTSSKFT